MKKIVILYSGKDDWDDLAIPSATRVAFEDWYKRGASMGVEFLRSHITWYDPASGKFEKAWTYREKEWVRIDQPFRPDGVYDKTLGTDAVRYYETKMEMLKHFPVVNHPFFNMVFSNKLSHSLYFGEWMPKSILVHTRQEFALSLERLTGEKIVCKPLSGSGGKGVVILNRDEATGFQPSGFPVLVQELLLATQGIPGFSKASSVSDLRLTFVGDKLMYALSRTARSGSLLTNFHQGAKATRVPLPAVPEDARILANKILKRLAFFPRTILSLDFMFDQAGKVYLMELNTKPGFDLLQLVGDDTLKEDYLEAFCTLFE